MSDSGAGEGGRCVFVYGTLRRGEVNDINRLQPPPRYVGPAHIGGTLYHLGAYPGVRLDGPGTVAGEVYAIQPGLEAVLDRLESVAPHGTGEYAKREADVAVDGRVLRCLVYEIQPGFMQGCPVIAGGDWVQVDDAPGAPLR